MSDEFRGMLEQEARQHSDVGFEFVELKKHRGVRLWYRNSARLVTYSKSASDRRAILNCRTDVRRIIAKLREAA
jgi:hypothetical protein